MAGNYGPSSAFSDIVRLLATQLSLQNPGSPLVSFYCLSCCALLVGFFGVFIGYLLRASVLPYVILCGFWALYYPCEVLGCLRVHLLVYRVVHSLQVTLASYLGLCSKHLRWFTSAAGDFLEYLPFVKRLTT